MDQFLSRVDAQRRVINIVNREIKSNFPLVSLSAKSLEKWKIENSITDESELINNLFLISSKLFFLSNKSQEQITNEYRLLSKTVDDLIDNLNNKIKFWIS